MSRSDNILKQRGITAYELGRSEASVLVLGRYDWDEDKLDNHIELRRGSELRVYSQEMFLAYLATDQDPYDDPVLLEEFVNGHPAFEFMSEWGFDWPHTTIVPSRLPDADDGDPETWPEIGLLKYLGYTVGAKGIERWKRQQILRDVFTRPIPNVTSVENMSEWGEPNTSIRLKKLANTIASLAQYAQRRRSPPIKAIREWNEDLDWLEESFYRGRFRFQWPSTYVN